MRTLPAVVAAFVILTFARPAAADPWFGWGENAAEDRFADGDLDEEDAVAMRVGAFLGATDVHGESWVSLAGFARRLLDGKDDVGALLVVGLALDRIAQGPVHRLADPARAPPLPVFASDVEAPAVRRPVPPRLARDCVAAAWRASGLGVDDARIDALIARSRAGALLPEARLRAMRLWTDATHATLLATTDATNLYDAVGANLALELRLTWRLDRILYAGDEPTLERVRLERQDARSRLAVRTLDALFAWERASVDVRQGVPGSRERLEAELRLSEAEATLDVLTGGWFAAAERSAADESSP